MKYKHTCYCGKEYRSERGTKKYCSFTCQQRVHRRKRRERDGKTYTPSYLFVKQTPEEHRRKDNERQKKRMRMLRKTPAGNLMNRVKVRINETLRNKWEGRGFTSLLGYSGEELARHIEKQFLPGMSWENRSEWHIDHIIPISAFHFECPEDIDFKRCWDLSNLRPLWKKKNLSKGNRLKKPFQPALNIAIPVRQATDPGRSGQTRGRRQGDRHPKRTRPETSRTAQAEADLG